MTGRDPMPGDVAMVRFAHGSSGPVFRVDGRSWVDLAGNFLAWDQVSEARPLVVIDPEDRAQVDRLVTALLAKDAVPWNTFAISRTQSALRSLVAPPRPEEPTGLGAVVEDDKGCRWVRIGAECGASDLSRAWADDSSTGIRYADIPAVRVLSVGVAS